MGVWVKISRVLQVWFFTYFKVTNIQSVPEVSAIYFYPSFFWQLSPGFYTHFILLAQLIAELFATLSFNFSGLFCHSLTASATVLSFLLTGVFYLALLPHILGRCLTQIWAGTPHLGSCSVPALTRLSFPPDAWYRTTHIVDTRPLVYQSRQWATKYKVTRRVNMFQPTHDCSKSYGKDNNPDLFMSTAQNCFNETTF